MARRQALIAKRVTKPRVTRTEAYLINSKYLGDEPTFTKPLTDSEYGRALTWYNYMCTTDDARQYIETYLKENGRQQEAKKLRQVNDQWIPNTVGWVCRLLSKKYELPTDARGFVDKRLEETLARVVEREENPEHEKVSIQQRMREKAHDVVGEIEELIDKGEPLSLIHI